jgi:maleylpyruvate isomerase
MESEIRLHGYWRSSAAYRVRLALNLKGVAYTQAAHDLRRGDQASETYRALQPQGLVPALEAEGGPFVQSPAILEWIEEQFADPPLLPADAAGRAIVRGMAAIIACDVHPLNNMRMLKAIRALGADEAQVQAWIARWIGEGFTALETLVARHGDGFAFGATPTLADCFLVPQLYSAERFDVDLAPYPRLVAAGAALRALPAAQAAHPDRQSDADRA